MTPKIEWTRIKSDIQKSWKVKAVSLSINNIVWKYPIWIQKDREWPPKYVNIKIKTGEILMKKHEIKKTETMTSYKLKNVSPYEHT